MSKQVMSAPSTLPSRASGRKSKSKSARNQRLLGKMKLIMCPLNGLINDSDYDHDQNHDPVAYNQRTIDAYNAANKEFFPDACKQPTQQHSEGKEKLKQLVRDLRHETPASSHSSSTQPSSYPEMFSESKETVKIGNQGSPTPLDEEFEISLERNQNDIDLERRVNQAVQENKSDLVSELTDPEEKLCTDVKSPRFSRFVLMQKHREDSERNGISVDTESSEFVPLPCICGRGERCNALSVAFANLNDPRSGYTKVPHIRQKVTTRLDLEVNRLRDAFLRCMLSLEDQERFDDSSKSRYIANHHFHPEVVAQSPTESGHTPIPMFFADSELKRLGIDCCPKDQVLDFDGSPTEYYYVVPSYKFDDAKKDLERAKEGSSPTGLGAESKPCNDTARLEKPSDSCEASNLSDVTPAGPPNMREAATISSSQASPISQSPIVRRSRTSLVSKSPDSMLSGATTKSTSSDESYSGNPTIQELRVRKKESLSKVNDLLSVITDSSSVEVEWNGFDVVSEDTQEHKEEPSMLEEGGLTDDTETNLSESKSFDAFETDMRLFAFEAKRRSIYIEKMTSSAVKWRSSVGWFQAGVSETAAAEHWVTMAASAVRYHTEDESFKQDKIQNASDSEQLAFLTDISTETKKVRQELETKIESVKAVVNTSIAELKSAEGKVSEAWDAFNTAATESFFGDDVLGSASSNPSHDTWDLEMRYRVAVAAQASAWNMALTKMTKLFICVTQTENERREWLLDLLVEVVGVASSFSVTRTPLQHIGRLIQTLDEKLSKSAQQEAISLHSSFKQPSNNLAEF